MGKIKNGYKVIKNILNEDELNLLTNYTELYHRFNTKDFDIGGQNNNMDTCVYNDTTFESLLLSKQKRIEQEVGFKLFPTYVFWRMYTYGSILEKHTDRPSCEISCTITLYSDGNDWPIYLGGTPVILKPGDGVIYEGCDIEHWREQYLGDGQSQVFLHYVEANGKYKDHKYDKRRGIGYPPNIEALTIKN
jgi:hypothetical protein